MPGAAPTTDDAPPFIAVTGAPVVIGRSGAATVCLLHPTVSRRHATLTRAGGGLAVEDHDSRFGTFVNGARVRSVILRTGDRVQFGSAVAYRVEPGRLRRDVAAGGMALAAAGLAVAVPDDPGLGRLLDRFRHAVTGTGSAGPMRPLIEDVGLEVPPETFTGILGPSGAGKSTLLNCLAGYRPPDRGRILFDGGRDARAEAEDYRAMLGHVPQDDVVFRPLTARENLAYAARLRLGRAAGAAEVEAAIAQALERVDLAGHAHKPAAVLSGGQRKRLSVAIELLRRPRLLLLDEPTSGLDPAGEAHLMEQLRHLARGGTTVVCTTHLMDNLRLLNAVVALGVIAGVGRVAYAGPPEGLLPHFGCRGFADLYEVLATGRFEPVAAPSDPPPTAAGPPPGDAYTPVDVVPVSPPPGTGSPPATHRGGAGRPAPGPPADAARGQLAVVTRRSLRLVLRDRGLVAAMVIQPVALALLVALAQYDASGPFTILFLAVVIATWLGLNHSARDLVRERRHYVRDRLAGLRPGAYLGGKALVHAAVGLAQVLALLAALRLGCGLAIEPGADGVLAGLTTPRLAAVLMLAYFGGVGLGLLASTLARTEEAAVAALPLLILPQLLVSAVAAGVQDESYATARPFRPLIVTLDSGQWLPARAVAPWPATRRVDAGEKGPQPLRAPAVVLDLLSLACLSRPAALIVEAPGVGGYGRRLWLGDLAHLMILLLGTWALLILAFHRAERRWLRSIGL